MTQPDAAQETWTYNEADELAEWQPRGGQGQSDLTYDPDRGWTDASSWTYAGNTGGSNIVRDAAGRITAMDTTLPLSVATIQQTWTYDDEGRLASHTQNSDTLEAIGAGGRTVAYTYDTNGRRETVTYPGGATVEYEYDADGRTTAIKRNGASLATYTYDPVTGGLGMRTLANGVTTSYGYNLMGRTTSITVSSGAATLWEATYGYDAVGNRTWSKYGTQGDAYAYDATYQVTGVKYGSATPESGYAAVTDHQGSSTWTYDPAGNSDTPLAARASFVTLWLSRAGRPNQTVTGTVPGVDSASTSYTTNDINAYTAVTEDGTPVNIAHSSRADLSAFGDWSYTNDVYGNIIQAANGTQTVRFYFDGANKRVGKEIDTDGPIWWLHDGIHLVEEYDSVTSQTTEYIYEPGIDRPLAMISGGVTKFFHQDVLGNVVALTNGGGDLVEQYRYDVWGNFEALDQNGDPIQSDPESIFLFTARQWDPEPDLYYYRARSYSQELGRFMQQDPIRFRGRDLNIYRYVQNNALQFRDPMGLDVWIENTAGVFGRHQRICVDTWSECCTEKTGKYCISFGHAGGGSSASSGASNTGCGSSGSGSGSAGSSGIGGGGTGIVYVDPDTGDRTGEDSRHSQDCEADKRTKEDFESQEGDRGNYHLTDNNCRHFSEQNFTNQVDNNLSHNLMQNAGGGGH